MWQVMISGFIRSEHQDLNLALRDGIRRVVELRPGREPFAFPVGDDWSIRIPLTGAVNGHECASVFFQPKDEETEYVESLLSTRP